MAIAHYEPAGNVAAEWTLTRTHQRSLGKRSLTASPGPDGYGFVVRERMRQVREVLETIPSSVDPDAFLAVLEATVTAEHAVLSVGDGGGVVSRSFVAFAQEMFPNSRNFSQDEQREYNLLVSQLYDDVDVDEIDGD